MAKPKSLFNKLLITILLCFVSQKSFCDINQIDFSQIKYTPELKDRIEFLKENQNLYDHWVHDWSYPISKTDVIEKLSSLYNGVNKISPKNTETYLLLGDIAHYLYNIEVEKYYAEAVTNYQMAANLSPNDYRVYWFLAHHYSTSAQSQSGIQTYQLALKILPKNVSSAFWKDYSFACSTAGMLATAKFAAHQASVIEGKTSYAEQQVTTMFEHLIKYTPIDSTINSRDMWSFAGRNQNKLLFVNPVIGVRFAVDSLAQLDLGDYKNKTTYFTIGISSPNSKTGKNVGYTMAAIIKVAQPGQTLQQFISIFSRSGEHKQLIDLPFSKINNGLVYEIKDSNVYKDLGGGRFYEIAFSKDVPDYPGMKLETPEEFNKGSNGMNYYSMNSKYSRLKSKLYYYILLDTCEDIYQKSFNTFVDFLNGLTIE